MVMIGNNLKTDTCLEVRGDDHRETVKLLKECLRDENTNERAEFAVWKPYKVLRKD